jgi:4'-phosphopantetheinyl transferase
VTAPDQFSLAAGAVHVWQASLAAAEAEVAACEALLDPTELARARRFHFERDRRQFTLARGFLRQLLGRYLNVEPTAVRFALGPHGKPLLALAGNALRFNLSHSGAQALFVFAPEREVGVDLEAGSRLGEDWPGLAKRIFSPREQAELAALRPEVRRDAFLNGWTRKEAYLKATGQGLVNGLAQIEVTLDPAKPAAFLSAELATRWSLFDLRDATGLAAALVVEAGSDLPNVVARGGCGRIVGWRPAPNRQLPNPRQ